MKRASDARWFAAGVLAVALMGVASCADSPTSPLSRPSFDIWTQNPSGNPTMLWTGRSGSSAITAAAAFGVGGAATLTVTSYKVIENTTPVTISSAPAGCISKIQVKAFGADERQVWVRNFNSLHPAPDTWQYTIPFVNGELLPGYRLHVQVNVACNDPRRTDVVEVEGTVLADVADLVVPRVTVPAALNAGQVAEVIYTLGNTGTAAVAEGSYVTGFYLSTDNLITTSDVRVGVGTTMPALGVGATSSPLSDIVTVPVGMAGGTYYFGVIVDPANTVTESNETNNVGLAAVTVTGRPDLLVATVTSPAVLGAGQGAAVSYTLRNAGTAAVEAGYRIGFYLSTDTVIETSDVQIGGGVNTPALGAGVTSSTLTGVMTVPAGTVPGTYYFGVIVDPDDKVAESNEANNVRRAAGTLTVTVTDAQVGPVQIPTSTGVGQETFISALVTVPLGLAAASGACELRVGNPLALVATQGKTIAAGGAATCEFVYTFGSPNASTSVEIRFTGVSPTDANLTNNVQSAVVNVTSLPTFKPTMTATWQLYDDQVNSHAFEMTANYLIRRASQLYDTLGSQRGFAGTLRDTSYYSDDQVGNVQYALFNGAINSSVSFPLTVSVSQATSDVSSRTVYHSLDTPEVVQGTGELDGTTCADIAYLNGAVTLNICSYPPAGTFPYGHTQIRYVRNATNAVTGQHWYNVDYRPATPAYTPEFPLGGCIVTSTNRDDQCYTWLSTTPVALAPYLGTYEFVVDLTDARYHYSAHVSVNLKRGTVNLSEPAACSYSIETDTYDGGMLRRKYCAGMEDIRNRLAGTTAAQSVLEVTAP